MPIDASSPATTAGPRRRSADAGPSTWVVTRDLLAASVAAPVRPLARVTAWLAAAVVLAETVGFVVRRSCAAGACGEAWWVARLDMDALGSVPRTLVTLLLAGAAVLCLDGARRAGRQGAALWWAVLAGGCAVLAAAKHASLHSLVESRLAGVLPSTDVQLLFVVLSGLGLLVALVAGRWVRRDTRTAVVTWLALYAAASVGLAALTVLVAHAGPVPADIATLVEEVGEGLAALGLCVVLRAGIREVAARH